MSLINVLNNPSPILSCGRLTLTSGDPFGYTSVTAGTTIYFAPYQGNGLSLYRGGAWENIIFPETQLAVPSVATTMYDVFGVLSGSGLALEALAWSNDSTRATGITRVNGVMVKSGDATRRYLGSFRTIASGQTNDSPSSRCVWNYLNRFQRRIQKSYNATTWTYTTAATWRSANNSTTNRVEFVIGVACEIVYLRSMMSAQPNVALTTFPHIGIALNATNTNDAVNSSGFANANTIQLWRQAIYSGVPPVGFNYLQSTEVLSGTNSQTNTFSPTVDTNNVGDMQGFMVN